MRADGGEYGAKRSVIMAHFAIALATSAGVATDPPLGTYVCLAQDLLHMVVQVKHHKTPRKPLHIVIHVARGIRFPWLN
jgi:hypothetical protein